MRDHLQSVDSVLDVRDGGQRVVQRDQSILEISRDRYVRERIEIRDAELRRRDIVEGVDLIDSVDGSLNGRVYRTDVVLDGRAKIVQSTRNSVGYLK